MTPACDRESRADHVPEPQYGSVKGRKDALDDRLWWLPSGVAAEELRKHLL